MPWRLLIFLMATDLLGGIALGYFNVHWKVACIIGGLYAMIVVYADQEYLDHHEPDKA